MTKTITCFFDNPHDARSAVAVLEAVGIDHSRISIVARDPDIGGATAPDLADLGGWLTQAGISQTDADVYAEGVTRGGSLVSVRVDDDARAEAVLRSHGGVDAETLGGTYRAGGWTGAARHESTDRRDEPKTGGHSISDDPAPLSHLLHIPVLSDD